jgi:hypothetical protein
MHNTQNHGNEASEKNFSLKIRKELSISDSSKGLPFDETLLKYAIKNFFNTIQIYELSTILMMMAILEFQPMKSKTYV